MGYLQLPGLGKVHFHEYGTGNKPLLAFHGYGMTGKQFHVLEQSILPQYHIYGFDHFFHGDSKLDGWTEKQILAGMSKNMVRSYMQEWFNIYGEQRISVMAYSIGANLALILVEEYAHLIDDIILMAPDGLSVYKSLHFILHNPLGRALFSWATKSKWLAPFILKTVKKTGLIDESLYQIAYNEIDTEQKRLDTYYTLNLIRLLKPDAAAVAALINQHKIKCLLIFGRHDHLFPKSAAMPFIGMLDDAEVHEVTLGHWLVIKALDEYLAK
ncbi:Pimeloyl-ACP methyl ester carboxylesterase [Mucilaginibacter pineti]|uniref:Pimeloyl-ACP methyl ester carboxylesterase n=1 Tax=Mucilaginibacter pineti TaxID=1391627 RepID=A0A1G7DWB4_9SPHI|nr:alpha/beta hydrolase [Mucilaginibacter pineti]SDE55731.1 Pimeloyl-ACP methyl ester carboxylesterase [Mucilaginibacter pineti]